MEPLRPTFNCPFQDLPTLGQFILDAVLRDQTHLATKSAKYKTSAFLDGYQIALQAVNDLVNPATFTAQHKKLTAEIDTTARDIRPLLNDLDIRLADAAHLATDAPNGPQLNVRPADFGLKPLRSAITDEDPEGIASTGKDVLDNLTANSAALTAVEYPAADRTALAALLTTLATANVAQNRLISARDGRVQENLQVLNDFYDRYAARVIADGKKAYKEADTAKTHDYTFARLKARVAAQRPAVRKPKKAGPPPAN